MELPDRAQVRAHVDAAGGVHALAVQNPRHGAFIWRRVHRSVNYLKHSRGAPPPARARDVAPHGRRAARTGKDFTTLPGARRRSMTRNELSLDRDGPS